MSQFTIAKLVITSTFVSLLCSPFGFAEETTFIYKSTPQAELKMHVHFPPDWKPSDKRPAIVFFFGGGWNSGSVKQFESQANYLASRGMVHRMHTWKTPRVPCDGCEKTQRNCESILTVSSPAAVAPGDTSRPVRRLLVWMHQMRTLQSHPFPMPWCCSIQSCSSLATRRCSNASTATQSWDANSRPRCT